MDARSGYLLEKLPRSEVEDLALEEVPDIGYEDIGGLAGQIETIKDAVELPYLYADYYKEHHLAPPKGVLLYGPPGCGKTMIAKAVANNLAARISETRGEKVNGYFLNIKGPELLNKYVGETERKIREIFIKAREKAAEDVPVVVFFDEMDALFRTRGTGISSDVETTIVPQLLAEIDGVEHLKNVIVIGASNRQDLIDPAILRPGRLDVKIKIERPDAGSAVDIFNKYMTTELPIHESEIRQSGGDAQAAVDRMIAATVEEMYSLDEENRFLEVTYANGDKEVLYFKDFSSGAMIESVVRRAKKLALKRYIRTGREGHQGRRPPQRGARGVQGERGPAQHDQSGRLGQDRRQERRADRLRQAAHRRVQAEAAGHRAGRRHRAVPLGRHPLETIEIMDPASSPRASGWARGRSAAGCGAAPTMPSRFARSGRRSISASP